MLGYKAQFGAFIRISLVHILNKYYISLKHRILPPLIWSLSPVTLTVLFLGHLFNQKH